MADEFDEDFDELDSMLSDDSEIPGLEDPSDNPDDVSLSVVGTAGDALKSNLDTEKIGNNLKKSILKSMPGEMGEGLDNIIGISDTVIDKTNKQFNSARRKTANTLSGLSEVLPEFLGNSVKDLSNFIKPESDSSDSSQEQSEDEKITSNINSLFGEAQSKESIVSSISETTNTLLNKHNNEILASIAANTKTALDLKIDIDNKYYRKDLELQMKQTLTLVSMLDIMKRDSEIRTKQFEAIVKNTALPDFAKSRSSDFVKEMMIKNAGNVGLNAFKSTSVYNKASKSFSNLINNKMASFVTGIDMLGGGTEALQMAKENGGVASLAIEQTVDGAVSKATDAAVKVALKSIMDSQGGAKNVKELDKFMADPELTLEAYVKAEEEKQQNETIGNLGKDKDQNFLQRTYNGAKSSLNNLKIDSAKALLEELQGTKSRVSYDLEDTSKLGEAQQLDGKLKKSIEYVIPNLLGKLLSETTTIRKTIGGKEISKEDEVAFNFNTNSFVNKKDTTRKLEKSIDDKAVSLVNSINNDNLIKSFTGKKKIDDVERKDFISGMMNYLLDGKTTSPYYMEEKGFLDYFKNDALRGKITTKLRKMVKSDDPEVFKKRTELDKQLKAIQTQSTASYKDLADKVSNTTDTTVLEDIGLTTPENGNEISSKTIKDLNKKYSQNVISRISKGKITEDDKYKDSKGKILPGFASGGGTGIGDKLEVAGVVHKNEYVLNEDSLKDIIEDVKTGNEESIIDKVTDIVKDVGKDARSTKTYDYLNKKLDTTTANISELANEANTYFTNNFKDKTYIDKPKLNTTTPYNINNVGNITNFKQSDNKYKKSEDIFSSMKNDIDGLITDLTKNISITRESVTEEFNKFTETLPKSFDEATTLFTIKFNTIKDSLPKSFDEIDLSIKSMSDNLTKGFTAITNMIPDSFKSTMNEYLTSTKEMTKSLKEDFKTMSGVDLDEKYNETKELSGTLLSGTTDLVNRTFTNKPINSKTKFSTDNKGKNSLQNVQQFNANKDKSTLDRLSDMFSSLTKSFSKTGDDISENLDKNNSVFESITSRFPDYKDMSTFFNDTGKFITSLISSNKKLDGVEVPEELTKDNANGEEEVGIINRTFTSATKTVSEGYNTVKKIFEQGDMSEEMSENLKSINKAISDGNLDGVLYEGLMETPLPKNYSQAVHLYKKVINGIDPSGKLWTKLNKDKDFIPSLEKIHIEAIAKGQRGLLEKTGDKLDDGLDKAGGLVGKARDKILDLLPAPVRKYVEPLLKNRFTKFGAKTIGRAKEIFKGAGKATLKEFGMVGKNVKDAFIGKDGKVRLPNAYELAKLTGKTAFGTSKALSVGIKTLYPELFGLAKDTVGLGVSTLWDFLGIKKAGKVAMAKMKAIIIPPIDRKLYKAWTKGDLTSAQVFDKLKTEKDQEIWAKWLKDNTKPGITLPEIMTQTGKWYIKTMYGVSDGLEAVTKNKTVRSTVFGLAKGIGKGVWNFTVGYVPGLHIGDVVTKPEKSKLTFTDLIDDNFIEIFVEQVATINEELKVSNASLLNKPITNLKKSQARKLTRLIEEINRLYMDMESDHNSKLSNVIDKKISQMLVYVSGLKELKKKPTKKKDEIKDVTDNIKDKKPIKSNDKDTDDETKKDINSKESILDKFMNTISKVNETLDDYENIKTDNNKKSDTKTKKEEVKDNIEDNNNKFTVLASATKDDKGKEDIKFYNKKDNKYVNKDTKKEDDTILGSFKKSMETITETFSKKIDEVKVESKEKKPEFSPFDHDKDGDRDGNRLDRMKKLYGKSKDKVKNVGKSVIGKVKEKKSLLGTLIAFSPLLIGMFKKMLTPAFNLFGNIKDAVLSIPSTISNIFTSSMKGLSNLLSKSISGIVSHIPGVKTVKNLGTKALDKVKNLTKIAPKGKIDKFLQTLRVLKKKVIKKLGMKAGAKILSKIGAKLIPGVGTALLAWDLGWVAKYMSDGLSWKSAVSKQLTGFDFFKEDEEKDDVIVKDIMDKKDDIDKPINNPNFTQNDSNRFKKKNFLANNLNFKNKKVTIDAEDKPKDVTGNINNKFTIGKVVGRGGELFSPDNGENNITAGKGVDLNNLNPIMKNNLFGMANEYNKLTGKTIPINSAFRSYAYQAALKKKYGNKAASPGKSTHEFGLAVDMNTSTANELDKLGLMKKYGFTRPVGEETWHVEPAGIQGNLNNAKHNVTLASKLAAYSVGKGGLGWGTKKGTRKYSRNLKYQLDIMKAKGNLLPDDNKVINTVDTDKTVIATDNKVTQAVPTHKYIGPNTTDNKHKNKINDTKPKTTLPSINIKTSNTEGKNNNHFDKLHHSTNKQTSVLEKSLKVHNKTNEKMSELVELNKNILSVLESNNGNHSTNKQKNNNNYSLPSHDDVVSHRVKDF